MTTQTAIERELGPENLEQPSRVPRLTLGMPVFNGERHIATAIRVLQDQTFRDWELIICDNGSTDDTPGVVRAAIAGDPRIRYVRGEVNRGASWTYNLTFWLARGELFKWHAHDDACAPTMLEECVRALDETPAAVLAYAWTRFIDDDGTTLRQVDDILDVSQSRPDQRLDHLIRNIRDCNAVFGVIRHDALARTRLILPFHPSDIALLHELSLQGSFAMVPEHLFFRRMHPTASLEANLSRRARRQWYDASASRGDSLLMWRLFRTHWSGVWGTQLPVPDKLRISRVLLTTWPVTYARRTKQALRRHVLYIRDRLRGRAGPTRWQ